MSGKRLNQIINQLLLIDILYVPNNSKEIRHAYISKHNSTRKNKVILLMIPDNEK